MTADQALVQVLDSKILCDTGCHQGAMRSSRLPAIKKHLDFDLSFQLSIRRKQVESLHELGFLDCKGNFILLGPPGVGESHLGLSLAVATAQ